MPIAQFNEILNPYNELLKKARFLIKIHDDSGYTVALEFIERLMETMGDNPDDPLWHANRDGV
jgi:hypothetical protein